MPRRGLSHYLLATALAAGLLVTRSASAASITFNYDQTPEGTAASGGAWLQAVFSDSGPGTVQLTLAGPGLTGNDSLKQLFFNLDPALDPNSLVFTEIDSTSGAIGTVQMGRHAFKPDCGGKCDILISFSSPAPLTGGDSITYSISASSTPAGSTGSGHLTAASFDFPSAAAAGRPPVYTAASVETTTGGTTTQRTLIAPPDPVPENFSTAILIGIAVVVVAGLKRKLPAA